MLRTLRNRHSVFPFDCSANCWGAGDVTVYLKADISNYAQSEYACSLFPIFHPPRCCALSRRTISRYLIPHQSPAGFFYTFRLAIVSEGISSNWTRQEAAHWRRLPSSFHRKLRLRSNKPTRNFPSPRATLWPAGRGRKGRSLLSCCPFLQPRILPPSSRPSLVRLTREPRNELPRPVVTSKNLSSLSLLIYSTCHVVSCTVPSLLTTSVPKKRARCSRCITTRVRNFFEKIVTS